jgi:hypothetical protein
MAVNLLHPNTEDWVSLDWLERETCRPEED